MVIINLKIIGIILILLALLHLAFPKYFSWKQELTTLSLINRQMMYIHTFFIGLMVLLMGILCFTLPTDLVTTAFGKKISLGFGIFWAARLYFQFFGYSAELWKGKRFETVIHILFSILWMYLASIFFYIYLM
jgi:hypothetical protein